MKAVIVAEQTSAGRSLAAHLRSAGVDTTSVDHLNDLERMLRTGAEEPFDLILLIEPLQSTSLANACRTLRSIPRGAQARIIAVAGMRYLLTRELAQAGLDDIIDLSAGQSQVAAQVIAARRGARADQPPTTAPGVADQAADSLYRQLFDQIPDAIVVHDTEGRTLIVNPAVHELTGYTPEDIAERSFFELFESDEQDLVRDQVAQLQLLATQKKRDDTRIGPLPVDILRKDGEIIHVDLSMRSMQLAHVGDRPVIQSIMRDMTETARISEELTAIQEVVQIIATEHDIDLAFKDVLTVLADRRGYPRASIWGISQDGTHLIPRATIGQNIPKAMSIDEGVIGRVARIRRPVFLPDVSADPDYVESDASTRSEIAVPMLSGDRLIGVINVESDADRPLEERDLLFLRSLASQVGGLIERAELYQRLERQATTDMLTGLPNRQTFQEELDRALNEAGASRLSLLILGIDRFKGINDVYGLTVADDVLRQVAQVLRSRVRPGQYLARYTSDQFAVILPGITRDDAVAIAEDFRIAVATRLFMAAEQVEQLTVSIGAATCPDDAGSARELLQAADHAMYLAKRAGTNQTFQSNAAFATLASAHGRINDLLRQSPRETLALLIQAMDQRLPERHGHSERVTRYSLEIARRLGISDDRLRGLRLAAYIHDIGMMSIPDALLRKPTALTADERKVLQTVPTAARGLLAQIELPEDVLLSVVHLREWYDGSGHPAGLQREQIPLGARIIAVADAIDALTSPRAHRNPVSIEAALELVNHLAGTQFDPAVATAAQAIAEMLRGAANANGTPDTSDIAELIMQDLAAVERESRNDGLDEELLQPFVPPA